MVLGGAEAAVAFCRFLEQSAMAALSMAWIASIVPRNELWSVNIKLRDMVLTLLIRTSFGDP